MRRAEREALEKLGRAAIRRSKTLARDIKAETLASQGADESAVCALLGAAQSYARAARRARAARGTRRKS